MMKIIKAILSLKFLLGYGRKNEGRVADENRPDAPAQAEDDIHRRKDDWN